LPACAQFITTDNPAFAANHQFPFGFWAVRSFVTRFMVRAQPQQASESCAARVRVVAALRPHAHNDLRGKRNATTHSSSPKAVHLCYAYTVQPESRVSTVIEPSTPKPTKPTPAIVQFCKALVANPVFDIAILVVILVNAVVLGLETYESVAAGYHGLFDVAYDVILAIYVVEILIRFTATGWNVRAYVADRWNVFDFIVVSASFVPGLRGTAMLLRLVRLARIVRIVRFLPDLRIIIGAIGRSIPGVASLAAATGLLVFIYGMLGWVLFAGHDPVHYGNVGQAMLTMFVMLTLENFPDNVAMGQEVSQWTIVFFISYAVIMSFLIFNLFIGLVLGAMEEARAADREKHERDDLLGRLRAARTALEDAERELERTHRDDR
jgi:voltage-gated sodium channel